MTKSSPWTNSLPCLQLLVKEDGWPSSRSLESGSIQNISVGLLPNVGCIARAIHALQQQSYLAFFLITFGEGDKNFTLCLTVKMGSADVNQPNLQRLAVTLETFSVTIKESKTFKASRGGIALKLAYSGIYSVLWALLISRQTRRDL